MLLLKKKNDVFKKLSYGKVIVAGRNNSGKITTYHRGSGHKRVFRFVDFKKFIVNVPGFIVGFTYDPNRTALLSLIAYSNGVLCYSLGIENTAPYTIVSTISGDISTLKLEDRLGYTAPLKCMSPGINISALELRLFGGAKYIRAGGAFGKLVSVFAELNYAIIKLKGRRLLKVNANCYATVGVVYQWTPLFQFRNAGWTRLKGIRPTVRGVAMNPIDHPHGGGQGKTSGGRPSVSPWAKLTKGLKTKRKYTYGTFALKR